MPHLMESNYRVVGHRGNPEDYPENSRDGLRWVVDHSLDAVELDIQVSQDGTCFVIHDDHTRRVSNNQLGVTESHSSELSEVSVHEPARFGERYFPSYMLSLKQACEMLAPYSGEVFLELKKESLLVCDAEAFVMLVKEESQNLVNARRFISFDYQIVQQARLHNIPCGWVLRDYSEQNLALAQQLNPDYLIIDYRRVPDENDVLWPGRWQWFLYDICDIELAQKWAVRGARYVESWAPSAFIA